MGNSGSINLLNRVKRHLRDSNNKRQHWHIDYLLENSNSVIKCLYLIPSVQYLECLIAQEFLKTTNKYIKKIDL